MQNLGFKDWTAWTSRTWCQHIEPVPGRLCIVLPFSCQVPLSEPGLQRCIFWQQPIPKAWIIETIHVFATLSHNELARHTSARELKTCRVKNLPRLCPPACLYVVTIAHNVGSLDSVRVIGALIKGYLVNLVAAQGKQFKPKSEKLAQRKLLTRRWPRHATSAQQIGDSEWPET